MNSMLAVQLPDTYEGTLFLGFQVFVIGMATVFSVLILIWGILSLFSRFSGKTQNKDTSKETIVNTAASPVIASDDEIIAVIAAAIAAAESDCPGAKFRVVSFIRK